MRKIAKFGDSSTTVVIATAALGLFIGSCASEPSAPDVEGISGTLEPSDRHSMPVFRFLEPSPSLVQFNDFGVALPVTVGENLVAGRGELKKELLEFELAVDAAVEYKALMVRGDTIVYSWQTNGSDVYTDFHGHDEAGGPDFFTRYKETESAADAGTILAPYSGQHGWYWLNISGRPITIKLEVAGFYDEIVKFDIGGG
jgi:hypothetical protein